MFFQEAPKPTSDCNATSCHWACDDFCQTICDCEAECQQMCPPGGYEFAVADGAWISLDRDLEPYIELYDPTSMQHLG